MKYIPVETLKKGVKYVKSSGVSLLTVTIFQSFFYRFSCSLWTEEYLSGTSFLCKDYYPKSKDERMLYLNHWKYHQIFSITEFSCYLSEKIAIELFKRLDIKDQEHKALIIILRKIKAQVDWKKKKTFPSMESLALVWTNWNYFNNSGAQVKHACSFWCLACKYTS